MRIRITSCTNCLLYVVQWAKVGTLGGQNERNSSYTGCLLISVACLGIYNLLIFWSLRAEILNTLTSKVYK